MYSLEMILSSVALVLAAVALALILVSRVERRLTEIVTEANGGLSRDVAGLMAQVKTLVELWKAGMLAPQVREAPPAPPPSRDDGLRDELRQVVAELRQLRAQVADVAAARAPQPAPAEMPRFAAEAPPPAPERRPVPARLLDAVLHSNLSNSLLFLQEQGGAVSCEEDLPGAGHAVAKLLSLNLARADERGIYLTQTGDDVASLLLSVGR